MERAWGLTRSMRIRKFIIVQLTMDVARKVFGGLDFRGGVPIDSCAYFYVFGDLNPEILVWRYYIEERRYRS